MVSETIWVKKFTNDVDLLILPIFDLQIQDGCHFCLYKCQFFKIVIET